MVDQHLRSRSGEQTFVTYLQGNENKLYSGRVLT